MAERPLPVVAPWRWWLGFCVIVAIGVALSILAYREGLTEFFALAPQLDKVVHFILAGLLAFFLDGALARRSLRIAGRAIPLAAIGILVPCALDEAMQSFALFRTASLWDYLADVAGVVAFTLLSRRVAR